MSPAAPDHVWALRVDLPLEEADVCVALARPHGLLGLTEEDGVTSVWFTERPDDGPGLVGRWQRVRADGWDHRWRERLEPVVAGPFVISPPWRAGEYLAAAGATPATDGAPTIEIVIEPAQAFGTGHHETTTLCLEELATVPLAGRSVLDVGTGTGVLGIAAARRGAAVVVGCDTDPVAVSTARDNRDRNGVDRQIMRVVDGSVTDLPASEPARYDVVVANLDTATIGALAADLVRRCGGRLIVSGVSAARASEAEAALRARGTQPRRRTGREWVVLTAELSAR